MECTADFWDWFNIVVFSVWICATVVAYNFMKKERALLTLLAIKVRDEMKELNDLYDTKLRNLNTINQSTTPD